MYAPDELRPICSRGGEVADGSGTRHPHVDRSLARGQARHEGGGEGSSQSKKGRCFGPKKQTTMETLHDMHISIYIYIYIWIRSVDTKAAERGAARASSATACPE